MIETWPPLWLFAFYVSCSSATAVSTLLLSEKPCTLRQLVGTAIFHGLMGGALGMQVFEWKKIAWAALMVSVGYGAGVVKIPETKAILTGLLDATNKTNSPK